MPGGGSAEDGERPVPAQDQGVPHQWVSFKGVRRRVMVPVWLTNQYKAVAVRPEGEDEVELDKPLSCWWGRRVSGKTPMARNDRCC